jgi:hypothetical protein
MAARMTDVMIHIDETLKDWQQQMLEAHMRAQQGVIALGYHDDKPHLMLIEYDPDSTHPSNFIQLVLRHGFHAERVG